MQLLKVFIFFLQQIKLKECGQTDRRLMRIGRSIKVAVRFPFSYCQSSNIAINSSKESRNVNLKDYKISFQHKTNISLVKSLLVFSACKVPFLVNNAEELLKLSRKIFGEGFTKIVLKASFFGQFCAGEDENSIKPTIQKLEIAGIGSILDYAAESDVPIDSNKSKDFKTVQCRVYDYSNEELCDFHTEIFSKCIRSVKAVSPTGFAAIKCTALGNPELLKRVSVTLNELKNLFLKLDKEKTGFVCRDDFLKTFGAVINGQNSLSYFDSIDSDKDGKIDYIEWTNGLDILELHNLTEYCTERGPLFASVLNPEERVLFANMKRRLHSLASLAKSEGVRIMIDAEQTYFQPAIDNLTYSLSKQFNGTVDKTSHPVVFSTYQMYLKDTAKRLTEDVARARKGGYVFAAKLVRGAYMDLERSLAAEAGRSDPVHDSIQQTHLAYDQAVRFILQQIADGQKLEVMIATHNSQSVENAMHLMEEFNLDPKESPVYFGQLLGMSDHLTYLLGAHGYKAYKYVPYGKVGEVMPYLIRRAKENSSALGGADKEISLILQELQRRLTSSLQLPTSSRN